MPEGNQYDVDDPGVSREEGDSWGDVATERRQADTDELLEAARLLAITARERIDRDDQGQLWDYCQRAAANAEAAEVLLEGVEILEDEAECCPACGSPSWGVFRCRGIEPVCLDCGTRGEPDGE